MILHWTLMLTVFILFENVKGWNSSSDTVNAPDVVKLQALDMWRLEVKWMLKQNVEQRNQAFEIQVGRTINMDIVDSMNVSRGSLEAVHTLVWTSQLPLNCVNHSVRIRLVSGASPPSSWSSWKTNYGEMNVAHNEIKMFPKEQVLRAGSTVMFCCIYPKEKNITSIFFGNTPYGVINISSQVKAIRVENMKATNSFGVNFYCDNESNVTRNLVYFPPEKPQNFRCETEDMRHAYCVWNISRTHELFGKLLISDSESVDCNVKNPDAAFCSFDVIQQQMTYNITLLVKNSLGQESETYIFNITDRVFPVPVHLEVNAGVFDSLVILQLDGSFKGLLLVCQIELKPGGIIQDLDKNGSDSMQSYAFRLQPLKPSTQYSVRGRCAVQGNDWGRWTTEKSFNTEPLVTIDLWRKFSNYSNRTVKLLWKTVSSASELSIEVYEVCVSNGNSEKSKCINVTQTQVQLSREINISDITVRAIIQSGLSVAAHITVSAEHTVGMLRDNRIMGNEKGFQLTWTMDSTATCGYTIEWCMLGIALPCDLQWIKVPANQTSLNLNAGDFKAGVQYAFEICGCSAEGHRRHEKQIGYLEEQKPTLPPKLDSSPNITRSSVKLKWSFNENDPNHTGFIIGYAITIQDFSEAGSYINVNDPHSKSWTVSGLEENRLYTFQLAACTSAGCGPKTTATFRTRQNYYLLTVKVLVPLLVLVCCCACLWSYRNLIRFPKESFSFLHIKALDLDEDLYEMADYNPERSIRRSSEIHSEPRTGHRKSLKFMLNIIQNFAPSKVTISADFNTNLNRMKEKRQASEKIRTLMIEDCEWCDVEILDVQPMPTEKSWLTHAEDPRCSFIAPKVTLPSCHLTTDLTNFTYVSSVPSEELQTEATNQESEILGFSSDYVTSEA